MSSIWRSKLGGEFQRASVERLEGEHLIILRQLRSESRNASCADCGNSGNSWASVNLGVFLCDRCADIHRALGTHVSKVKACGGSDLWGPDEIARMQELDLVFPNKEPYYEAVTTKDSDKKELMDLCMKKYGMKTWSCENLSGHGKSSGLAKLSSGAATETFTNMQRDDYSQKHTQHNLPLSNKLDTFNFDDFFDNADWNVEAAATADVTNCKVNNKLLQVIESTSSVDRLKAMDGKCISVGHTDIHGLFEAWTSTDPSSMLAPAPVALKRTSTDEVFEGFDDW
jgi:hypothetical protein